MGFVTALTVPRVDGAPLDLRSVTIARVHFGRLSLHDAVAMGGEADVSEGIDLIDEIVEVRAVTSGGEVVATSLVPLQSVEDLPPEPAAVGFGLADDDPVFELDRTDVASVTFGVGFADPRDPLSFVRVDPALSELGPCIQGAGNGRFGTIGVSDRFVANDADRCELAAISVDGPAPIPVPAGPPLLPGGLGALAIGARRGRRLPPGPVSQDINVPASPWCEFWVRPNVSCIVPDGSTSS